MRKILLTILSASLASCASVRVNGYEVTTGQQVAIVAGAVVVGAVIASESKSDQDAVERRSPGEIICKYSAEKNSC